MTRSTAVDPRFAVIGLAGYIAPRHLRAIKDVGGRLLAALDPSDSVGVIDSYFPDASFFVEFERFDRHVHMLRRRGDAINYVSICSPNFLHDAHIRFALRAGADAICEKPLVLNPKTVLGLGEVEKDTGRKIFSILQLRHHPAIIALRDKVASRPQDHVFDVDLTYITSRGLWYYFSWKGDERKSGGIATNIGIHFFDMLTFVFGPVKKIDVHLRNPDCAAGVLTLERACVRWFLSINAADLPPTTSRTSFRSMTVDGEEIEFSDGFTDLHTESYREIFAGRGFGLADVMPSIEVAATIRTAPLATDYEGALPVVRELAQRPRVYEHGVPVGIK